MINVYGDKFTVITNDALTKRINLSSQYINKYNYNPDLQIDLSKWNGKDNLYDNIGITIGTNIGNGNGINIGIGYGYKYDNSILNINSKPIFNRRDFLQTI